MGWLLVVFFVIFIIALLHEKAEDKAEEKAYNNGYCPKCGKFMSTIHDEWGNSLGFGCTNCGHRTSDRYIGSEILRYRKENK